MQLIILAAGKGERLKHHTASFPKPLVPLYDGSTLLERMIDQADQSNSFSKILIVTGYNHHLIEDFVKTKKNKTTLETIYNSEFDHPSPVYSVKAALPYIQKEDTVLTVCDNIYNPKIFDTLPRTTNYPFTILASLKKTYLKDEMRLQIDKFGYLIYANKYIEDAHTHAASTNLIVLRGEEARALFSQQTLEMMSQPTGAPRFYHHIFNRLVSLHHKVKVELVPESWWYEIDDLDDYAKMKEWAPS